MSKRLGLFCFWDEEGIVDKYVEYLLQELKENLTKLVVIVNGNIKQADIEKINLYAQEIYFRENTGYDGGAYAEYIRTCLLDADVSDFDEIVLCNNSFFGPIISLEDIFNKMEENEEIDFWGLRLVDKHLFAYLESYFLVFRKAIVRSGDLFDFFAKNDCLDNATYLEVCSCFERGLFAYLEQKGYRYGVYGIPNNYDIFCGADINTIYYHVPIVKKKITDLSKYKKEPLMNVIGYLQGNSRYNVELIFSYMDRKYGKSLICEDFNRDLFEQRFQACERIPTYECEKENLEKFVRENREIYIYGAGFLAGNIWWVYKYKINEFKGFIVSKKTEVTKDTYFGEEVKGIDDVPLNSNIIVALNKKNTLEVKEQIEGKYNVFYFWDVE